ncbi:hypothetical protein Taro_053750 [Colocasia esculenta]|uniref:Uncharacterized protein n=1 Tax=Colocasia esculenta TaxID=4460 RepID=A0A843XNH4_COLES|nr:hypothetical protein [Colocasia esculenta]
MDMNAQERLVAAMEMLHQDIALYAQAQREAHVQIKEEVLNLTVGAFLAENPRASLDVMTQVMNPLDNLKLGHDMLLHQFEGYWEALTDAERELYHGTGGEQQAPPEETLTPHLITTYSEMVTRALALEAANEVVDKIRGKSGEGSSDKKRKYESGNVLKVQQTAKKHHELERAPTFREVFDRTHKRKGIDDYISESARTIAETYDRTMTNRYAEGTPQPDLDPEAWVNAAGGPSVRL